MLWLSFSSFSSSLWMHLEPCLLLKIPVELSMTLKKTNRLWKQRGRIYKWEKWIYFYLKFLLKIVHCWTSMSHCFSSFKNNLSLAVANKCIMIREEVSLTCHLSPSYRSSDLDYTKLRSLRLGLSYFRNFPGTAFSWEQKAYAYQC